MSKAPAIPSSGRSGNRGGQLMLVGFVLFFVSWFVPVHPRQDLFAGLVRGLGTLGTLGTSGSTFGDVDTPDWLPGWGACKVAWNLLIDDAKAGSDDAWKQRLLGSSCLTNGVMVLGMVLLAARRRALVGLLLLVCTAVNASWIYLLDQNPFEVYRAGYFLWLASFALVGFGALLAAMRRS